MLFLLGKKDEGGASGESSSALFSTPDIGSRFRNTFNETGWNEDLANNHFVSINNKQ